PPCGFGIAAGRSGRIKLHSASGTSAAAITIPPSREGQTLGLYKGRFCYRFLGIQYNPVQANASRSKNLKSSGGIFPHVDSHLLAPLTRQCLCGYLNGHFLTCPLVPKVFGARSTSSGIGITTHGVRRTRQG